MMRITSFAPPADYAARVQVPGSLFLAAVPKPTNNEFREKAYWTRMHQALYDLYGGICSYCASWMPRAQDQASDHHSSVDHMLPKSIYPEIAYAWDNFRLSRRDINENKDDDCDVVDPIFIQNNWFELDFLTCRIRPSGETHFILKDRINHSLRKLKLNESPIIDERTSVIGEYVNDRLDFETLSRIFPFIAQEIKRQNLDRSLKDQLKAVHP